MLEQMLQFFRIFENSILFRAIRQGLILSIPILLAGSAAMVGIFLPIPAYQDFIHNFSSGLFYDLFQIIYQATFGMLSVYIVLSISTSYSEQKKPDHIYNFSSSITALVCFFIMSGAFSDGGNFEPLNVSGMFTAIICAIVSNLFFFPLTELKSLTFHFYTEGANTKFNNALSVVLPSVFTIAIFAVAHTLMIHFLGVDGLNELFHNFANSIFAHMGRSALSAFLFIFLSSLLWFFGIHGNDVLETVSQNLFESGMTLNEAAVLAGAEPTQIFTKTFFDVFVLMGGCGATLSLVIAILLFDRQRSIRNLSKLALVPMVFNMNELLVFGIPVVLNPFFLIPFLLTPLITTFTSYLAILFGLVPVPSQTVEWITPIILGGYSATGSIAGSLLQIFNLIIGILIYRPFVLIYEKSKSLLLKADLDCLIRALQKAELHNEPILLTELPGTPGAAAKMLIGDLEHAMDKDEMTLYYQPQHHYSGTCIASEALLRWHHPTCGLIYPPLVIELAKEADLLMRLELLIFERGVSDLARIQAETGSFKKTSINVTPETIAAEGFLPFLRRLMEQYRIPTDILEIEITEQSALRFNDDEEALFEDIQKLGISLGIDDFSMGHTSLKYLQTNHFNLVKLDGSLTKNMMNNPRCTDIISSLVHLSNSLHFSILAEFVETDEQKELLHELGCDLYQGYYYSPALSLDEFIQYLLQDTL